MSDIFIIKKGTFWLTRIVFLRCLSFIYVVAFLIAKLQNKQLIGYNGLTPADTYMAAVKKQHKLDDPSSLFLIMPTVLWFLQIENGLIDIYLDILSWFGIILSSYVLISGKANMLIMVSLWLTYHSIVNVGQIWYSFGWESQLLEIGFLAIFLCPFISLKMFNLKNKPSFIPLFLYRWLIFRIMIGAGMIKVRGDKCWTDLTCMNYHYETQPVPNPLSYYLHKEPIFIHYFETLMNHVVELICPWLLLLPQPFAKVGGFIQIIFQVVLIISGNLSFLNWLTILPSICCFEDFDFQWLFSDNLKNKVLKNVADEKEVIMSHNNSFIKSIITKINIKDIILSILIGWLSIPVVKNIMSSEQIMNTSFDSFRLVNTYGAFGSVTKIRTEVIIEGTLSSNPYLKDAIWKEYEFKCKPGNIFKRPCIISPYHYRLDWLMWFAAFQNPNNNIWLYHLIYKFLKNDNILNELILKNPFEKTDSPKWIRAQHYKYKYTNLYDKTVNSSQWWKRSLIGDYIKPINLLSLKDAAKMFSWDRL